MIVRSMFPWQAPRSTAPSSGRASDGYRVVVAAASGLGVTYDSHVAALWPATCPHFRVLKT